MTAESPGKKMNLSDSHPAEDLAINDMEETAKRTFSPVLERCNLCKNANCTKRKHKQQLKTPEKEPNLNKDQTEEKLNQKGEINNDCLNIYKDGMCHISCTGRPCIKDFFNEYPQIAQIMLSLQEIRKETCKPISQILQSNHNLLSQLLIILKPMFNIKRFCSTSNTLQKNCETHYRGEKFLLLTT